MKTILRWGLLPPIWDGTVVEEGLHIFVEKKGLEEFAASKN